MGMGNSSPIIDNLTANSGTVAPGGQTTLTCVAHDPDGTIDKYVWSAPDGSFPGGGTSEENPHPTNAILWTAPAAPGDYVLTCTVVDTGLPAASTSDTVTVTIGVNQAPVIDSLTPSATAVLPGNPVNIVCSASDPESGILTYTWSATGGTISGDADADPEAVVWTASAVAEPATITVTATDPGGATSSDSVAIDVRISLYDSSIGPMELPCRVAAASWGEYFVTVRDRVLVYRPDGTLVREITGLDLPRSVAVSDAGELFIGEAGDGGIRAFDWAGVFLRIVAPPGTLNLPGDMCLDGEGALYVTDSKADLVRVFDIYGGEVDSFGGRGINPGQFRFPTGIAYDAVTQRLFVADQKNRRVQILQRDGTYLASIESGGSGWEFGYVQGLARCPSGRIFAVDSFQGHVAILSEASQWLGSIGTFGPGPGQLSVPNDTAIDPSGKLVVTSTNSGRIEVYQLIDCSGAYGPEPPAVTGHPSGQTVTEGQTATFSVTATASGTLTYQWMKDGVDIAGANADTYTTPATGFADNGVAFTCAVTSSGLTAASSPAVLTVKIFPPAVTSHPSGQAVVEGQTATFSIAATSSGPITYRWKKDGVDIAGADTVGYTTPAASLADDGAVFACEVANAGGAVTSGPATLSVSLASPTIAVQPADQVVTEGQMATFRVTVTSSGPVAYQWKRDDVDIGGATSSNYTTQPTALAADGAVYMCAVANSVGTVSSSAAKLMVNMALPVITGQPADQTVTEGQTATFSVAAASSGPVTYRWEKNGIGIVGANAATYTPHAAVLADDGAVFTCAVRNARGTVKSARATRSVTEAFVTPFGGGCASPTGNFRANTCVVPALLMGLLGLLLKRKTRRAA